MRIAIDIRPLMEVPWGGVSEYTYHLLKALIEIDKKNEYFLFYNSFRKVSLPSFTQYPNISFKGFHLPNKLLNIGLKFLKWPKLDRFIISDFQKTDIFFIPNLNFLAWSKEVKTVLVIHDLSFEYFKEFYSLKKRLWHKIINVKKLCQKVDKIIAVSENTKNDLIELYQIEAKKIQVIYPGLNKNFINPASLFLDDRLKRENTVLDNPLELERVKKKYHLPSSYILFLGTIEPRKNIEAVIKAFSQVKNITHYYDLIIVGAAPSPSYFSQIQYLIKKEMPQYQDKIHFLQYIPPKDKPAIYSLASLFIYPSFYEGFGFPVIEAMASNVPVITSYVSSLPEVAGKAALLIDPYNINELAKAMEIVLSDTKLRDSLIKEGQKQAQKFRWQKTAQEILEVFKGLVPD